MSERLAAMADFLASEYQAMVRRTVAAIGERWPDASSDEIDQALRAFAAVKRLDDAETYGCDQCGGVALVMELASGRRWCAECADALPKE
jgi:hypothetical protein